MCRSVVSPARGTLSQQCGRSVMSGGFRNALSIILHSLCFVTGWRVNAVLKWETYLVWKPAVKTRPVWVFRLSFQVSVLTCFYRKKAKGKVIYREPCIYQHHPAHFVLRVHELVSPLCPMVPKGLCTLFVRNTWLAWDSLQLMQMLGETAREEGRSSRRCTVVLSLFPFGGIDSILGMHVKLWPILFWAA